MLTLPGLIDPHVHLRDPGQTHKENFTTGTAAALAGGFTTILDMPNNATPVTTAERLLEKQKIARNKILCDVGFYFTSVGDNLKEFDKIQDKVFGLKLFLNETTGNLLINIDKFRQICAVWPADKPILVHAEENILSGILDISKQTIQKIHVCHISSKNELKIIMRAKEKNQKVTCGVTPHHLFLSNTSGVAGWNEMEAMTPPRWSTYVKPSLKSQSDVNFLWQHLEDIDVIESDHAPHTIEEKEQGAFGFPGLETTLPLLLTAAHERKITIDEIVRLCYENPAKIFGITEERHLEGGSQTKTPGRWPKGLLQGGGVTRQTYIQIDENKEWTIQNENLFTKCKWSPFNSRKVKGRVKKVILRGTKVFEDGKILVHPGFGKIIYNTY